MYANFLIKNILQACKPTDYCCLCHESDSNGSLCRACLQLLPPNLNCCERCALPLELTGRAAVITHECQNCVVAPPPYRSAIVPYLYGFPVDDLVHEIKYNSRFELARAGGELLSVSVMQRYRLSGLQPDAIVAVPLAPRRLSHRGYNQAHELARWCAKACRIALVDDWVWRTRETPSQSGLDRDDRQNNLHGSFAVSDAVAGKHILLIDDVMTTGATFNQLTRCLIAAGAAEVDVCALARTARM